MVLKIPMTKEVSASHFAFKIKVLNNNFSQENGIRFLK
jgi:hypothetical protein